jgi:hypothetical protein
VEEEEEEGNAENDPDFEHMEKEMDDLEKDEDVNQDEMKEGPLDPRAGAVDVILPQLQVDYKALADKLYEAGGGKLVKKRNRGLLYTLATQ